MADTTVQRQVETWIVCEALPDLYGQPFAKRRLPLVRGGAFEFDAVSNDGQIAVCISTSQCLTAGGKLGIGKQHKIRADVLYLLHASVQRRVLVFTDAAMLAHFEKARIAGRFPPADELEMVCVQLPDALAARLCVARASASDDVSPLARAVLAAADEEPVA
jgi:hypothetical protein